MGTAWYSQVTCWALFSPVRHLATNHVVPLQLFLPYNELGYRSLFVSDIAHPGGIIPSFGHNSQIPPTFSTCRPHHSSKSLHHNKDTKLSACLYTTSTKVLWGYLRASGLARQSVYQGAKRR
jgi:hypothetical protein